MRDEALSKEIKKQFQLRQSNGNSSRNNVDDEIRAENSFVKAASSTSRKVSGLTVKVSRSAIKLWRRKYNFKYINKEYKLIVIYYSFYTF